MLLRANSVLLPRDANPVFPRVCFVCGGDPSDHRMVVDQVPSESLEVPVCEDCEPRAVRQTWTRFLLAQISLAVGGALGALIFDTSILTRIVGGSVLGVGLVVAVALLGTLRVPYFRALETNDAISYEFSNPDVASRFSDANGVGEEDRAEER